MRDPAVCSSAVVLRLPVAELAAAIRRENETLGKVIEEAGSRANCRAYRRHSIRE